MATATGKAARRQGGNRYAVRKTKRQTKHEKKFTNNAMSPEQYRAMKLQDRKALKA